MLKNLRAHRCPVHKCTHLNLLAAWDHLRRRASICMACGATHMINKNVNGFRRYKGILLCCDCYRIPEIQDDLKGVWTRLLRNDAIQGRWCCALCQVVLFDPVTLIRSRLFERDHMDVFSKVATVWELVTSGAPFEDVLAENQKCRNLCVRCHAAVTCAERATGLLALKSLDALSPDILKRAQYQTNTLAKMLLS